MGKVAPYAIFPTRVAGNTQTDNTETAPPEHYQEYVLTRIARQLARYEKMMFSYENPVEEYETNSTQLPGGQTTLTVQPDFATKSECIKSVLVTGPVTTAFTLALGGRFMSLSTDATGKCLLAPVSFWLKPGDARTLTSVTAGDWFLQLSGYAAKSGTN